MKKWCVRVYDNNTQEISSAIFCNTRQEARICKKNWKVCLRCKKVTISKAMISSTGAFMAGSKVYY
ncbi:hypothetical protein [Escherichia phage 4E8]|nr:hypothetical protein [Escherichia phage 4E8]